MRNKVFTGLFWALVLSWPVWVVIITVAVLIAPSAHATTDAEQAYLSSLNALGLEVYDAPLALQTGYWICSQLPTTNGKDLADHMFAQANRDEIPAVEYAQAFVVAAAMNLCPWEYHPERGAQQPELIYAT